MATEKRASEGLFNRATGVLVIEVRHSNPNGDPDAESDPRTMDPDGLGLISPVSYKRKLRDIIADKDGPVWHEAIRALRLDNTNDRRYDVLETRGRSRETISAMNAKDFIAAFWDGRVFGNTFLESMKEADSGSVGEAQNDGGPRTKRTKRQPPVDRDHFISTGVVQFGPGISIAPVEVERFTTTNKAGVEEGKDRGMAPLGWRVVRHGVYTMPFFVNPMMARKNGCDARDIELLKFVVPHAYRSTASAARPFVEIRHAWYAEHKSPLGSCPDSLILDALMPRKIKGGRDEPSTDIGEYEIPTSVPDTVRARLAGFDDLAQ